MTAEPTAETAAAVDLTPMTETTAGRGPAEWSTT